MYRLGFYTLYVNHKMVKTSRHKIRRAKKNFLLHRFLNTFSQLPAVKKYSKNGAADDFKVWAPIFTV